MKMSNILVGSENPKALADFYGKVFEKKPDWNDSGYIGYDCGGFFITIGPHDKVHGKNPSPERILIGFETEKVEEEFERIKKLGATVVKEPYNPDPVQEMQIATFADLDGNFFQLMTPWDAMDMEKAKAKK